jgi:CheY-like chemotaxis protein
MTTHYLRPTTSSLPPQQLTAPHLEQPKQVLYIDDDPSVATITKYSLELFADWYAATTDTRYALDRATGEPWDAILLEIGPKNGAGFSLYHELTTHPLTRHTPLILLTTRLLPADYRCYDTMAIAGVIAKPYNPLTLGSQIAQLLGWSTAHPKTLGSIGDGAFCNG